MIIKIAVYVLKEASVAWGKNRDLFELFQIYKIKTTKANK